MTTARTPTIVLAAAASLLLLAGCGTVTWEGLAHGYDPGGADAATLAAGPGAPPASMRIPVPANPANEHLLSIAAKKQTVELARGIPHCTGDRSLYMGTTASGATAGYAYWSIHCHDGREFAVQVRPDSGGSATALDCATLPSTIGQRCFQRF